MVTKKQGFQDETDPLKCPKCGGRMRIISFIEKKDQADVIEKILRHCGIWKEEEPRGPPLQPPAIPFGRRCVPIDEFPAKFR